MSRTEEELRRLLHDDDEVFFPSSLPRGSSGSPNSPTSPSPVLRTTSPDDLFHRTHGPQPPPSSDMPLPVFRRTSPYFAKATVDDLEARFIENFLPSRSELPKEDPHDVNWLQDFDPDQASSPEGKIQAVPEDEYGYKAQATDDEPVTTMEIIEQRKKEEDELRKKRHHNPQEPDRIPLVDFSEIPEMYRSIFQFPLFNAVQSKVYPVAYKSRGNLVVSSPTGSGKTTIFDMAFLRMLHEEAYVGDALAVYMAPTKVLTSIGCGADLLALCTERARDWRMRMQHLDIHCVECTGDTGGVYNVMKTLMSAKLIITTPEKWDALTRRSGQIGRLMARLALVMIDEVHFLRENRGATLEVVVSRIKALAANVRFVALSATVPNIDDIARWLGPQSKEQELTGIYEGDQGDTPLKRAKHVAVKDMPKAKVFQFGEEFRPVKLKKEIYGFDASEWVLNNRLDKELYPILVKHCEGEPVLVFCPTRRSCQATAEELCKQYSASQERGQILPWHVKGQPHDYRDDKLREMARCGVAFHHAGLDVADRKDIEANFLAGTLNVIVSTSTLAVGVNLPAHLVVIKGTASYSGPATGFREYSDIDIQQMMGRAGRPQFGTTGTCVIMCESSKQGRYRSMMNSQTILESSLHENLTEHINSEIGLGSIRSLDSAQSWLKSSFLFIRIQQNPRHYAAALHRDRDKTWEETLDHYVEEALDKLQNNALIEYPLVNNFEDNRLREGLTQTEYGKAMSNNVISFASMVRIMKLSPLATLRDLLELLAGAAEFVDLRIRPGEHQFLNKLRASDKLHYTISCPVENYADKVFLYMQVCFGNIVLTDKEKKSENMSLQGTLLAIFKEAPRLAKTIAIVAGHKQYGAALRSALELSHIIFGKAWENCATIFRQIESVGPKSIEKLDLRGIRTFEDLIATDATWLGTLLTRNPVFAMNVIDAAKAMPRFTMVLEKEAVELTGRYPVLILRANIIQKGGPGEGRERGKRKSPKGFYWLSILFLLSDDTWINYRRIELRKLNGMLMSFIIHVPLKKPTDKVIGHIGVDEVSGCASRVEYDPSLSDDFFPDDVSVEESSESAEELEDVPVTNALSTKTATTKASPTARRIKASQRGLTGADLPASPTVKTGSIQKQDHAKCNKQEETNDHRVNQRHESPLFLPSSSTATRESGSDEVERVDLIDFQRKIYADKQNTIGVRKRHHEEPEKSEKRAKLYFDNDDDEEDKHHESDPFKGIEDVKSGSEAAQSDREEHTSKQSATFGENKHNGNIMSTLEDDDPFDLSAYLQPDEHTLAPEAESASRPQNNRHQVYPSSRMHQDYTGPEADNWYTPNAQWLHPMSQPSAGVHYSTLEDLNKHSSLAIAKRQAYERTPEMEYGSRSPACEPYESQEEIENGYTHESVDPDNADGVLLSYEQYRHEPARYHYHSGPYAHALRQEGDQVNSYESQPARLTLLMTGQTRANGHSQVLTPDDSEDSDDDYSCVDEELRKVMRDGLRA